MGAVEQDAASHPTSVSPKGREPARELGLRGKFSFQFASVTGTTSVGAGYDESDNKDTVGGGAAKAARRGGTTVAL